LQINEWQKYVFYLNDKAFEIINLGIPVSVLKENNMFEKIISIKYDVANNELEKFDDYKHEIDDYYASIMARHA